MAVVLVRVGAAGLLGRDTGRAARSWSPAPDVGEVVDTNGAGDTHSGAFLAAVAPGSRCETRWCCANVAAARAVTLPGGASWGPGRTEAGRRGEEG